MTECDEVPLTQTVEATASRRDVDPNEDLSMPAFTALPREEPRKSNALEVHIAESVNSLPCWAKMHVHGIEASCFQPCKPIRGWGRAGTESANRVSSVTQQETATFARNNHHAYKLV
jgi:hypothetical protein